MSGRLAGGIEWLAAAAAAVSLGSAAGPVAWHILGVVDGPAAQPYAALAGAVPDLVPPPLDALLDSALFGLAPVPEPQADTAIPATALNLTLLGVTLATPADRSRAVIAGGDRPVRVYAPGEAVTSSVRLVEVQADRVLLSVAGRTEALPFPKTAPPGAEVTRTAFLPAAQTTVPIATAGPPSTDPDTVIAWYRSEIDRSPQAVMDRLGLAATPQGYRILHTAPPEVRQAGFRPGDLVSSVNGVTVGDIAADRLRLDEIVAAGRATLELQRGGETLRMTFPLR